MNMNGNLAWPEAPINHLTQSDKTIIIICFRCSTFPLHSLHEMSVPLLSMKCMCHCTRTSIATNRLARCWSCLVQLNVSNLHSSSTIIIRWVLPSSWLNVISKFSPFHSKNIIFSHRQPCSSSTYELWIYALRITSTKVNETETIKIIRNGINAVRRL